jgi:hypothetical protein
MKKHLNIYRRHAHRHVKSDEIGGTTVHTHSSRLLLNSEGHR